MNTFFGSSKNFMSSEKAPAFQHELDLVRQSLGLKHVYIPDQTHGAAGVFVRTVELSKPVHYDEQESDYVLTTDPKIGVGVITADCLPIMLHAQNPSIVAAVHSGWRGTMQNIVNHSLAHMIFLGAQAQTINVQIGPSAQRCCYEVSADFIDHLRVAAIDTKYIESRDGKYYFDNQGACVQQLLNAGVHEKNINLIHAECTMCSGTRYHSFRRDKTEQRQASLIWI